MSDKFYAEPIIIERDKHGYVDFQAFEHPYELNTFFYNEVVRRKGTPKLSIAIMSHKNLETLKLCVYSVLKYAEGIDYELVLFDNASEDDNETLNYFQSVPYERKKIIQSTNNPGPYFNAFRGGKIICRYCDGDYVLHLNDDHLVTENAIQNMIRALDSDPSIGMVDPMSSAVWMHQNPGLEFSSLDEMYEAGKKFNKYDPKKWQERIYVATVALMYRRELMECFLTPNPYVHELYCNISIRWEGYRAMLLGDTWVCHYHNYYKKETYGFAGITDDKKEQREIMKQLSQHYHFGLDQFTDICVFEFNLVSFIKPEHVTGIEQPHILGVDLKAGQGLLDAKNRLRTFGIFDTRCSAFTTKAKHYPILYTITEDTHADRIDFIQEYFAENSFNVIVCGEPLNSYGSPLTLLEKLYSFLAPGGVLIFRVRNTDNYNAFLRSTGLGGLYDPDTPALIAHNEVAGCLEALGGQNIGRSAEHESPDEELLVKLRLMLEKISADIEGDLQKLVVKNYIYSVVKG